MTQAKRPKPPVQTPSPKEVERKNNSNKRESNVSNNSNQLDENIVKKIIQSLDDLKNVLQEYNIRNLDEDAEQFGPYLRKQRLETNQIRKFLDAINRLKADLAETGDFSKIETEVVLLKPKLAYAAARQRAAKPLSEVMSKAINIVHNKEDFERLVQLIESIIAYNKAEGG